MVLLDALQSTRSFDPATGPPEARPKALLRVEVCTSSHLVVLFCASPTLVNYLMK